MGAHNIFLYNDICYYFKNNIQMYSVVRENIYTPVKLKKF